MILYPIESASRASSSRKMGFVEEGRGGGAEDGALGKGREGKRSRREIVGAGGDEGER